MKNEFVETLNVQAFRRAMALLEDVERGQPGLGLVYGKPGTGKTVCAREYAVRTGCVYLRVLEDWSAREMLAAVCRNLNGSEPRAAARAKRIACEELELGRRPLLVDEADRLHVKLIEHLRDVHELAGVPVVLIGEESLLPLAQARGRLWDRMTQKVRFGPVGSEDIMIFALKAAGLKVEPAAAVKLESRSGGTFRRIWQDMFELEQMARANAVKIVTHEMVDTLPNRNSQTRPPAGVKHGGRNV